MNGLLALAFAAGMLAPVNPCGFALLPAWITHTLADVDSATRTSARTSTHRTPLPTRLARALRAGTALTLGFTGTLTVAGLAISAGARALITAAPWLGLAVGIILLLLGAATLTGRTLRLRLPATSRLARVGGSAGAGRLAVFGVGYAAASLSCTFGVLLAVIAQAQATATYAGLLAVFAAYTLGSAAILLLVAIATAAAGAALTRHLSILARHSTRITAVVLLLTGGYLAWYWYPAATGGATPNNSGIAAWSATISTWLQNHTTLTALAALVAVAAVLVWATSHRLRLRAAATRAETDLTDAADSDCCPPTADEKRTDQAASRT